MNKTLKAQVRHLLPRAIKRHHILAGPLQGASLYTSWHDYPGAILGTTEKPLLAWFERHVSTGETWIDAGAHYGYTALALCRRVGPAGRVFAFEPVLSTAGCVARTRQLNDLRQLQIVPVGLAASHSLETRLLPVTRGMADSTIARGVWEERISVGSFDNLWTLLCERNPAIHGVKIDVQGMELAVIEGMRGALTRQRPKLIIEFHTGVDRRAILNLLGACGYGVEGEPIDPVESGAAAPYEDDKSYVFYPQNSTC
jgi:FkbM family methyltransferase